jgi:hypothetical protein
MNELPAKSQRYATPSSLLAMAEAANGSMAGAIDAPLAHASVGIAGRIERGGPEWRLLRPSPWRPYRVNLGSVRIEHGNFALAVPAGSDSQAVVVLGEDRISGTTLV